MTDRSGRVRALVSMWGIFGEPEDPEYQTTDFTFMADQSWAVLDSPILRERFLGYAHRAIRDLGLSNERFIRMGYGVMEVGPATTVNRSASVTFTDIDTTKDPPEVIGARVLKQRFGIDRTAHPGRTRAVLTPPRVAARRVRLANGRWSPPLEDIVTVDLDDVRDRETTAIKERARIGKGSVLVRERTDDTGALHAHVIYSFGPGDEGAGAFDTRETLNDDRTRVKLDRIRFAHRWGPWNRREEGVLWDVRYKYPKSGAEPDRVEYPRYKRWGRAHR